MPSHCSSFSNDLMFALITGSARGLRTRLGAVVGLGQAVLIFIAAALLSALLLEWPHVVDVFEAALYPRDDRRSITDADSNHYPGAGVLMCYMDFGILERGAAAWLIGSRDLVVLNAHNFVDRKLVPTHPVTDCFFRIKGGDYFFDPNSLRLGASVESQALHIADDWALLRLLRPVPTDVMPQPILDASDLLTGSRMNVVMVSPAGHSNTRLASTLEACEVHTIDEPTEGRIRRARHDCNDGYGGSGSGLFAKNGRMIALRSVSLDMNSRRPFDIDGHCGSALLFEGELPDAIRQSVLAPLE
jgi:hypothetical protein